MDSKSKYTDKFISIASYVIVSVYSIVTALSLFFDNDDYIWYFADKYEALNSYINPNGRYFSNYVTRLLVKYSSFRFLFVSITIIALILLLSRFIGFGFDNDRYPVLKKSIILSLLILLPVKTYAETFLWISGFTNYIFSALGTLIYVIILFNVLFKNGNFKIYHYILFPVIALSIGLCVEHIAIYNVILAIASIILLRYKKQKFYIPPFGFLIFSCLAVIIMFFNKNYSEIYESGDSLGTRGFNFDFSEWLMNAFRYVVPNYTKKIFVVNIIIALSFSVISYYKKDIFKKSKYALVSMITVFLYAAYSLFTSAGYADIVPLNINFKIRGCEFAFMFLYVVSLAYLIWIFFRNDRGLKLYFYLISTILLAMPFMFVNPVTARCFFVNYIFWILFACELLFYVFEITNIDLKQTGQFLSLIVCSCFIAVILNISVVNKYYYNLRIDFLKNQLQEGRKSNILVIDLPYPDYNFDDLSKPYIFDTEFAGEYTYFRLLCDYYDIDGKELEFDDFQHISTSDYYLYIHS
jgi:hypothetical protein